MTKVSLDIMNDIQLILDMPIHKLQHPVVAKLVEIIAKLVGSDEAIIDAVKILQDKVSDLEKR